MSASTSASIQTVFSACDFSETGDLALDHAIQMAKAHEARLVLGHVVEPIPLGPYPVLMAPENDLAIRDLARKRLDALADRVRAAGVTADVRVDLGNPGSELVVMSEDEAADVFVIGTRGLTGFQHVLLGSVAEYVVRRSSCPVLTVHPGDAIPEAPARTVIIPTDLSGYATHAVDAFVALFGDREKPDVVLTFADRTPPYLEPFRHDTLLKMHERDVVKEEIERRMAPVITHLRENGFNVETAVLDGDPVSVVTELATERNADLIVMNSNGRSAILNALLGKIAQRIVQHAPCPVLTVQP